MKQSKRDHQKTKTFIEQLRSLFSDGEQIEEGKLTTHAFSEKLFLKAPAPFMEAHSLEFLSEIVRRAGAVLKEQIASHDAVIVQEHNVENRVLLILALPDSPFIIKTLENVLAQYNLKPLALLHPILSLHGKEISLSTIVLDQETVAVTGLGAIFAQTLTALRHTVSDHVAMVASVTEASAALAEGNRDLAAFLHWLTRNSFVFLGALVGQKSEALGFLKDPTLGGSFLHESHSALRKDGFSTIIHSQLSPIHNRKRLICISVGGPSTSLAVVGLFSSRGNADEASEVPFLRGKVKEVLALDDTRPNTYDYKQALVILNSIPKLELLSLNAEQIHRQVAATQGARFSETSDVLLQEIDGPGLWAFAALPEERFAHDTREAFALAIEREFFVPPNSVEVLVTSLNEEVTRLHAYLPLATKYTDVEFKKIEDTLRTLTSGWYGQVQSLLEESLGSAEKAADWMIAFNKQYTALTSPELAVAEVSLCVALSVSRKESRLVSYIENADKQRQITIASLDAPIALSQAITILEHTELEVLQADQFVISRPDEKVCYLQRFSVRPKSKEIEVTQAIFQQRLKPLFEAVLRKEVEDDELSGLALSAALDFRQLQLLRTYTNILWQYERTASRSVMRTCLAKYPASAQQLAELFYYKFDPSLQVPQATRELNLTALIEEFRDGLRKVKDITDDRILRSIAAVIEQTVRSNFFHTSLHAEARGTETGAIAHKIHSAKLDILKGMRPLFEIYVFDPAFEGVHLRASKVSRGGIRWSDRREDYRTEVLGLMRTQRVKNCLIVPSGAKGGFVLKHQPSDRKELQDHVKSCYQNYIRALLSLADNRVGDEIRFPKELLIYDSADPYFVVAADKGTASFSDLANAIAQNEFGFWLDDAFASGGSHGYSHKALGITAKGAWEAAKVNLNSLGLDYENETISVAGIGDMSGDVFGNGMILSDKFKLLGTFNHAHVFIDPNPDPAASYIERQRLFNLPYSQWTDYDSTLISSGGAVFNRYDKEIQLSREAREALRLDVSVPVVMTGEQLISHLLRAPVDMLWNGGIGTYVKSIDESDADVNDGANDRVRVNASELRCRAVAEGGNLGFTARARVEYNRLGGKINSDAIDNSAGVDLSDHEVNLKLFFQPLLASNVLNREIRDRDLEAAANEVVEAVVRNNRYHSILLTIAENASYKSLEYFKGLIRDLVDKGFVQRRGDGLPEDEELDKRQASQKGLTRPELAVILAGIKMWVKQELVESTFVSDSLATGFLQSYFPPKLRATYAKAIDKHSLRSQIISTEGTNRLIDIVGITFVHRACITQGSTIPQVMLTVLAVFKLLGIEQKLLEVEKLYATKSFALFLECFVELGRVVRDTTSWILARNPECASASDTVELYDGLPEILQASRGLLAGKLADARVSRVAKLTASGVPETLATAFSDFPSVIFCAEAIQASRSHTATAEEILKLMLPLVELLHLGSLFQGVGGQGRLSRWEHELLLSSIAQIRHGIAVLALKAIALNIKTEADLQQRLQRSPTYLVLQGMITELSSRTFNVAILPAIARTVDEYRL